MSDVKFIIVYDTFCGWCYAATPVFASLVSSGAQVEVFHRYLFRGTNAYKMADGFGAQAEGIDAHIEELSGQEFSKTYVDSILRSKTEFLESGFTAQAAALIHDRGAIAELALAARLQKMRYVDGISAYNRQAVIDALLEEKVQLSEANKIGSSYLQKKALEISKQAANILDDFAVSGVPAVLKLTEGKVEIVNVAAFYRQPDMVISLFV